MVNELERKIGDSLESLERGKGGCRNLVLPLLQSSFKIFTLFYSVKFFLQGHKESIICFTFDLGIFFRAKVFNCISELLQ